ncbi:hypothetical protein BDR03DRAFT_944669 [Suillus americanus]|nr:hypothetical protein BDR03DRAFT_944669 [Suillus americanus]
MIHILYSCNHHGGVLLINNQEYNIDMLRLVNVLYFLGVYFGVLYMACMKSTRTSCTLEQIFNKGMRRLLQVAIRW